MKRTIHALPGERARALGTSRSSSCDDHPPDARFQRWAIGSNDGNVSSIVSTIGGLGLNGIVLEFGRDDEYQTGASHCPTEASTSSNSREIVRERDLRSLIGDVASLLVGGIAMGRSRAVILTALLCLSFPVVAFAQWSDPKLIAGQVGFNVALSFLGKVLLQHEAPRSAISEAWKEGTMSGLVAHAGYSIGGRNPEWALVGKALAQKSTLLTRRSMNGEPVFDETLWTHWELTHSFVHIQWDGAATPNVKIDAVNTAFSTFYLLAGEPYRLDPKRSLLSGSLVFDNLNPPDRQRGYYVPGTIWVDVEHPDVRYVLGHEIVHSFQAERGAAISEWQVGALRINWLSFISSVPALLTGWPEHDNRVHEIEADRYSLTAR